MGKIDKIIRSLQLDGSLELRTTRASVESTLEQRGKHEAKGGKGSAAKFNVLSEDLGGFREKIAPGFFDDVMEDDVRVLMNHDVNRLLGRTTNNTAGIALDKKGLNYNWTDPSEATTWSRDLQILMGRGDLDQSSFSFRIAESEWEIVETEDGEEIIVRTLIKASELRDVSPVTIPAYPQATVSKRSLTQFMEQREILVVVPDLSNAHAEHEYYKRKQFLLKNY